jgi:hypothetical protein
MKRASLQGRIVVAALIAALLSSVVPAAGASVPNQDSERNRKAALLNLARSVEVKVTAGPAGVLVEWRTSYELDNLGFNVYREQRGNRIQVNPSIIAAAALTEGQRTQTSTGYQYQWFDSAGDQSSQYYLEQVDFSGLTTLNGPFAPAWSSTILKSGQRSQMLAEVAAQAPVAIQTGGPAGTLGQVAQALGSIQDQWAIAAQPGLKIGIRADGWYRVTQPEMSAAGFDVSGDAARLHLYVDGGEVPIEVSKDSGPLGPNDFFEFYGTGVDTLTTDLHVYYLINGTQSGLRVPVFGELHGDAIASPSPTPLIVPRSSEALETPSAPSGPGWFGGGLSSGIVAAKEISPQPTIAANPSQLQIVPSLQDNEETGYVREAARTPSEARVSVLNPPTDGVRADAERSASKAAIAAPAVIQRKPKSRNKKKYRRRRARKRHSHAVSRKRNHAVAAVGSSAGFLYDIQIKERLNYISSLLNGDAGNFFGFSLITPPYTQQNAPTTRTLKVTDLQTNSQGTALLRIGLQGTSLQAHLVNVFVNDVLVGSLNYNLQQFGEQTFSVPVSQLVEGNNVIKFMTSVTNDRSLFAYAQLTYPRIYRADGDKLAFALRSSQSASVDGFTTATIRVLDVSNPAAVQEVRPITQPAGPGFSVTLPALGAQAKGSRTLLTQPVSSFLHPASIIFNQPSTLNQPSTANPQNAADLVIITHKSFLSLLNLALLVAQRQSQGLTVKLLDVEDIFDEFSYGAHTPQAITDFLLRARANWTKAPRYLLLVGAGTFDPRNFSGGSKLDLVPTKLVDTIFLETGSDDSLADFDNDGIAEIPVGRLPATTVAEANLMLSKVVNFSPSAVPQNAVMVADTQGSYFFNFEQANNDLISLLPGNMQANVQKVYRAQQSSDSAARTAIISKINSGTALVNYSGHGNVDVWTGAPIFSSSDALALTNGSRLPLVVVMDCLNGYFVAPNIDCLSEALLKAPNGGAVASFSSSGLTIPIGQHAMGQQLFNLLYSGAPMALGDATRQAKAATTDIDVRRSWILFGDPTMKIR